MDKDIFAKIINQIKSFIPKFSFPKNMVPRQQRLKRSFCGLGADPATRTFGSVRGTCFSPGSLS